MNFKNAAYRNNRPNRPNCFAFYRGSHLDGSVVLSHIRSKEQTVEVLEEIIREVMEGEMKPCALWNGAKEMFFEIHEEYENVKPDIHYELS